MHHECASRGRYGTCATVSMATRLTLPAFPIFFATTEGQTRRIAGRFASNLRIYGLDSAIFDVADLKETDLDWVAVRGVIVGGSVHVGVHQTDAADFVAVNVTQLNRRCSMFFSASLAAASRNPAEVQKALDIARALPAAHGWKPQWAISLAGRLAYTQYNFFVRQMMKRIARKEGAPTDTSRDYEFTDWKRVDALSHEFAAMAKMRAAA